MDLVPLLRALSESSGVSGYEIDVGKIVRREFVARAHELRADAMGNLIALRRGIGPEPRRRIMLAGHMDEIGLMVTACDGAFLRFTQVGGFDVRTLPGQEVVVHGRQDLRGIVGARPPHVSGSSDKKKTTPMDELFIDVGLSEEALKAAVRVGDVITLHAECIELKNERLTGKAFDDRAAVAAITVCLDILQGMFHEWDVYAVATVQEEVGLRGAMTSTFGIVPDVGIAIDVGFAKQPGFDGPDAIELGKGPALTRGGNVHPALFQSIKRIAEENDIPHQVTAYPGGTGTDANAIQITREGIPTGLLNLPERNMHTVAETICIRDIARAGRLLALFIASLKTDFLASLSWSNADQEGDRA